MGVEVPHVLRWAIATREPIGADTCFLGWKFHLNSHADTWLNVKRRGFLAMGDFSVLCFSPLPESLQCIRTMFTPI